MLNKIQIDDDKIIELDNNEIQVIINHDCNVSFKVNKNLDCKVSVLTKESTVKINIFLDDNSSLIVNQLSFNSSINFDVNLNNNDNLKIVNSSISNTDSINYINLYQNKNNSVIKFYMNGINLSNNKMYFNINGIVPKNLKDVYLEENSKIINLQKGDSKIIPNLIIDTKEVSANHSAFIGILDTNILNYLMSRGIDLKKAKQLMIKSILLARMELNKDDFIKEITLFMEKGGIYE